VSVYARILRTPGVAVIVFATLIGRMPIGISGLAILLFVREVTGSFASAGLCAGALALGSALGAPLAGRLVDRRGAGMLIPLAALHAAGALSIWLLGSVDAPTAALAVAAFVTGSAFPPAGAVLRARWKQLLREPELVHGAYALDSVTIEISFFTGPLLTAAIVALAGPEYALAASACLVIAGNALFLVGLRRRRDSKAPAGEGPKGLLGVLGEPAIRMIALTTIPVGFCIGTVEVALPAFSDDSGSAALAGVLLALWSAASGIGGLVFGAHPPRRGLVETYVAIALLFPLAYLPLAAASSPVVMAALVMLAGAPIAPLLTSRNQLVGSVATPGTATEAFTWLLTALVIGLSAGTAVAGAMVEAQGWPAAVLLWTVVAALGGAFAFARRESLHPASAPG
jgi:predicted MFS family arabinose efflux permease